MAKNLKKNKKKKKSSKSSKNRKRFSESYKDSYSDSSSSEQKKTKKRRKNEDDTDDHWEEKKQNHDKGNLNVLQRDSWMSDTLLMKTFTRAHKETKTKDIQEHEKYDPTKNIKELNPYWKSTGTGLPSFQKPQEDGIDKHEIFLKTYNHRHEANNINWRKETQQKISATEPIFDKLRLIRSSDSSIGVDHDLATNNIDLREKDYFLIQDSTTKNTELFNKNVFLTDSQMNALGAQILKAEIIGNMDDVIKLKRKMEVARVNRKIIADKQLCINQTKNEQVVKNILPSKTGSCRNTRSSPQTLNKKIINYGQKQTNQVDEYGQYKSYFSDGDKCLLKDRFESEKYSTSTKSNDIFEDKIHRNMYDRKLISKLDNCDRCFDSKRNDKNLLISIGENVYLALPWYIGLQTGHCIIIPNQHVSCSTQLDEEIWEEINCFRKSVTKMFATQNKDVIFFENANKLHHIPHLGIHCIPVDRKKSETAPFYFKKAIEESEHNWCVNKQLIYLHNQGLQKSIPKGLPYFWVNFGMDSGFAHVIEDETRFPLNFAQEIIGGMLELDPTKWRKLQKEQNILLKVKKFIDCWKKFDCTLKLK